MRQCAGTFDESIERNRHHCCSCKEERTSTAVCEVVEKRAQGTHSESHALVFIVYVVLEFVIRPIRVRPYSVNSHDNTRESVQQCASEK